MVAQVRIALTNPGYEPSGFLLAYRAINGTPSMNRTYTGRFRRPTTVSNGEGRKAPGSGSCPTQKPGLVDYSWLMTSSTTWYPSPDLNRDAEALVSKTNVSAIPPDGH